MFYRGNDLYDPENVGFVSNAPSRAGRKFFDSERMFQATETEDTPTGHLSAADKAALLEYLKTL